MIYIRDEGERRENGFNFYPIKSYSSIGFVFRFGLHLWFFRFSKLTKKCSVRYWKADTDANI